MEPPEMPAREEPTSPVLPSIPSEAEINVPSDTAESPPSVKSDVPDRTPQKSKSLEAAVGSSSEDAGIKSDAISDSEHRLKYAEATKEELEGMYFYF